MEQQFELQIHSIAVGVAQYWALYAVPTSPEEEIEHVECRDLEELNLLLTRLRTVGVSEPALVIARKSISGKNVSCKLGTLDLWPMDRSLLELEPVPGLTARDANHLPLIEQGGP
jgi:hypothetical protein